MIDILDQPVCSRIIAWIPCLLLLTKQGPGRQVPRILKQFSLIHTRLSASTGIPYTDGPLPQARKGDTQFMTIPVTVTGDKPAPVDGKRRLVQAALRLSARGASLSALGLRELAREAGLNHNTFYRHFTHIDELGQAAAEEVARQLMAGMKQVRQNAMTHPDVNLAAARYFLVFVQENPEPFIVGVREAHSVATPMRGVIQQVLRRIASESVEQITSMNLAPGIDDDALLRATSAITYHMLYRALDCIEHPEHEPVIVEEIADFIRMQFLGAAALQAMQKAAGKAQS